jgi:hypothetical protein
MILLYLDKWTLYSVFVILIALTAAIIISLYNDKKERENIFSITLASHYYGQHEQQREPPIFATYNNCISFFTYDFHINVICQGHNWKFDLPEELKIPVAQSVDEYKSKDVPLSAQAIFGPVTVILYQYSVNEFQLGLNDKIGEKRYPISKTTP